MVKDLRRVFSDSVYGRGMRESSLGLGSLGRLFSNFADENEDRIR